MTISLNSIPLEPNEALAAINAAVLAQAGLGATEVVIKVPRGWAYGAGQVMVPGVGNLIKFIRENALFAITFEV